MLTVCIRLTRDSSLRGAHIFYENLDFVAHCGDTNMVLHIRRDVDLGRPDLDSTTVSFAQNNCSGGRYPSEVAIARV